MNLLSRILIVEVGKIDDPVKKGENLTIATTKGLSVEVGKRGDQGRIGENRHRTNNITIRF
jgi:hypothetical protein